MSEPKQFSENLRKIVQNPQNDFEKAFAQLPCMQELLKSDIPPLSFWKGDEGEVTDWLDNQDVMQALHISPRTLQTLRSNGALPFSRIGNKIYYRRQDITKILSGNYTLNKNHNYDK